MTPIDAALDAAMGVTKILDEPVRDWLARVLAAAYAAQFPPVEEHAELVEELRSIDEERLNNEPYSCEQLCKKAADLIEALCARLAPAPVDDKSLVEAAERDRCAKVVDRYKNCLPDVIPQIVEEIRSGK